MNPAIVQTWNGRSVSLAMQMSEIITEIEELFGSRDRSFTFIGIEFVEGRPHIFYPGSGRNHVIIRLTMAASEYWNTAVHELAHESVHLLSPVIGTASNLEEGVATWYAFDFYRRATNSDPGEIPAHYKAAYDAVLSLFGCSENGPKVIRQLREEEPCFYAIRAASILRLAPKLTQTLADFLVRKWDSSSPDVVV